MSSFDENDRIMLGYLPIRQTGTLYSIVGNILIYFCLGYLIFFLLVSPNMHR